MEFQPKKLPISEAESLRICPVETLSSHVPVDSPVYVLLKRNEKFLAIKGPYDFFTSTELERLKPAGCVYFPAFIERLEPFRTAGRTLRAALGWKREGVDSSALPPHEMSDAFVRVIGPLWERGPWIEPHFVFAFVNELCDPLEPDALEAIRERGVADYERALLGSSLTVFLAGLLGAQELRCLNRLRVDSFAGSGDRELRRISERILEQGTQARITPEAIRASGTLAGLKILSRLRRAGTADSAALREPASIHGLGGFAVG